MPGLKLRLDKSILEKKYIYDRLNLNMLAEYFKTDRNTISRYLNLYDIPKRNHSRYLFDEYFFDKPNILNSYWAGFIAADGCIANKKGSGGYNYLSIGLSVKDQNHLEKFKSDIKFSGPVSIDNAGMCKLRIFSQKICDDLSRNFNIIQRKTLILEPPFGLSDECILSYFAGIIDGDGSIYYIRGAPTISLLSTELVLEWLSFELRRLLDLESALGISKTKNKKNNNIYYDLCIYKFTDIIKIYKAINELDIQPMSRKWDKIKNVLNHDRSVDGDND